MVRASLATRSTAWRGALAGSAAGAACAAVFGLGWLGAPYDSLQDHFFPAPAPDPRITLVAIDQKSARQLGTLNWPWSNSYHANVIRNLVDTPGGPPRVLVIDFVLDHASGQDTGDLVGDTRDSDANLVAALDYAAQKTSLVLVCSGDDAPIDTFARVPNAIYADRSLGAPDRSVAIRGVQPRPASSCPQNSSGEAAFVSAVGAYTGVRPAVPTGPDGQMLINFSDGKSPTCSYVTALNAPGCPGSVISGRIVVVGIKQLAADDVHTQAVAFQHDASFCPATQPSCMTDQQNYGYRIMADEIGTVLAGRYLRVEPGAVAVLVLLLLGAAAGGFLYLLPPRRGVAVALIGIGLYLLAAILLGRAGWLVDPIFAPLTIGLAGVGALALRYVVEERERRKVEAIFGQYVDPAVVGQLVALQSVDEVRLGGQRRTLTVLFADVRGFTTLAESLGPEEVVGLLNDFTDRSTAIIFETGGTLDKFIGDAVMAFWGAPMACPDHADRALQAALKIAETGAVALRERGVGVGIGLASGEVVVGNVGGRARKNYTAIGDVVNTASRLCSAAPAGTVLVADSTWDLLREPPAAEHLEPLQVKGRHEPVGVRSITLHHPVASAV